ncbi:MAG: NADH-quinone oxidoreductase subunit J [Anaerolineales bacterium]|nr:NADH-quinone oxidoreductase subunit J [Anaerolineales bacterium]
MGNPILFFIVAIIAIVAAVSMVATRNAVHSALFLILNFAAIAVFYLLLNAPFIAMVQITVYAGAIMVLFLFVIMLLGAERTRSALERTSMGQRYAAIILAVLLVAVGIWASFGSGSAGGDAGVAFDASPAALGIRLFEGYVFPFELTSILLLVAMIGVVVLHIGKRERKN